MPSEILKTIQNINTDLTNLEVPKHTQNLPNAELAALKQLRSNPFIVIKPADKGSSSVIMDKDNYISEGYRQLGNPAHYKKLDKLIFHSTGQKNQWNIIGPPSTKFHFEYTTSLFETTIRTTRQTFLPAS